MKDLSTVERSMTSIIMEHHTELDMCNSVDELTITLTRIFKENQLDTPATKRLIVNVGKKGTFAKGLQTIYDSMLYGSNLGVAR